MQHSKTLSIKRLQVIRESLDCTIEEFSNALACPAYASIEAGDLDLPGELVSKLLQVYSINPLWLYGESKSRFLEVSANIAPKCIVLNESDQELILMVNQKASAGYPQNILDREWYKDLPSMRLPLASYRNATHRGFQVDGESMLPNIYPGDWVIGKAIASIQEINSGKIYIVVLREAVVVKQVFVLDKSSTSVLLQSTNQEYEDLKVQISDIQELWEVSSKLSFALSVSKDNNLRKELQASMRSFLKD